MSSRYSWSQEYNLIKIEIPCKNPIINKPGYFDLFISRSYLKFHLKSPKIFMEFDFSLDINPFSSLNKTTATESSLQIVLAKQTEHESWPILINPDKSSSKIRREASQKELAELSQKTRESAEKARIEMDRLSVTEQMRLDTEKRQNLENRLETEKKAAISEIFSGKSTTQIFKDRTDLPQTREVYKQQVKFTPKRDPNMPARESTANEPPIPSPLRPLGGPAHESHPLFLKDKGDELYKAGDYLSAINAYTKALSVDPEFVQALVNKAVCFLRLFEFDKALECLSLAEKHTQDQHVLAKCYLKKGAALAWKGLLAEGLSEYRKANEILNDESIVQDIIAIEKRRESNAVKNLGDTLYEEGKWDLAEEKYKESVEIDEENEISYANLAQVALKLGKNSECVEYCDKALSFITHNNPLKVKVLLRKAKVTSEISFVEQALMIDSLNPHAKTMHYQLKEKYNLEQYDVLKTTADNSLKSGKFEEATSIYKQLLSTCKENEQKISLYTNLCACYLLAKDFHMVVNIVQKTFKLNPKPSIKLRLLCRRASAYAELGQLFSAQCDLKEALTLDPDNQVIKKDLEMLLSKQNN